MRDKERGSALALIESPAAKRKAASRCYQHPKAAFLWIYALLNGGGDSNTDICTESHVTFGIRYVSFPYRT